MRKEISSLDDLRILLLKMLGNLISKLKSQKSIKSGSQKKQIQSKKQKEPQFSQPQQLFIQEIITFIKLSVPIQTIRYSVSYVPLIFNQVLGCPISVFHTLTYSQRRVKEIDLNSQEFPQYLEFLIPILKKELPEFNHILINDYPKGIGIMPHFDGPAYHAKVFVLSLNSYCIINFQQKYNSSTEKPNYSIRLLLQPNSIHIFENEAYRDYLHGIDNISIDSILVKYNKLDKRVENANIDNFEALHCRKIIEEMIQSNKDQIQSGDIRIVKIEGHEEYTHKIQVTRKERISITIRQQLKK